MTAGTSYDDISTMPRSAVLSRSAVRWFALCALGLGLLGAVAGYYAQRYLPNSYATSTQMVFGAPTSLTVLGTSGGGAADAATASASAAEILRSQEVASDASRLLHGRLSAAQVLNQTSITSTQNSPVVVVDATAKSPALAQDLANAVPQAYLDVESRSYTQRAKQTATLLNQLLTDEQKRLADVQTQMAAKVQAVSDVAHSILQQPNDQASYIMASLDTDVSYQQLRNQAGALTTEINQTQNAIQQTTVDSSTLQSGVDRVIPADLPSSAARTTLKRDVAIGAVLGVLLGALIAWRATERRRTVDPAVAAATLGAPLLGAVGRDRRLRRPPGFVDVGSDDELSNELKVLAASLVLSARRRGLGAVVVTSAHRREGKSVLTRNLAVAAEYTGQPVVLVDAGFGRPTTTELLDLEDRGGLAEVVEGDRPARLINHLGFPDGGLVPVLPIGLNGFATEPGRKLNESRRTKWAEAVAAMQPMIPLVDAPAISAHPLALQLASGGGIVVIASPRTTLADLEVIRNRADVADVPVLGFVVNKSWGRGRSKRRSNARGRIPNVVVETAEDRQTAAG